MGGPATPARNGGRKGEGSDLETNEQEGRMAGKGRVLAEAVFI